MTEEERRAALQAARELVKLAQDARRDLYRLQAVSKTLGAKMLRVQMDLENFDEDLSSLELSTSSTPRDESPATSNLGKD